MTRAVDALLHLCGVVLGVMIVWAGLTDRLGSCRFAR